jgi:hypothetical protein
MRHNLAACGINDEAKLLIQIIFGDEGRLIGLESGLDDDCK